MNTIFRSALPGIGVRMMGILSGIMLFYLVVYGGLRAGAILVHGRTLGISYLIAPNAVSDALFTPAFEFECALRGHDSARSIDY